MKLLVFFISLFFLRLDLDNGYPSLGQQKQMINAVNKIRQKGCFCGSREMKPVQKIEWNDLLFKSAYNQAQEMHEHNFFAHYSLEGHDIGQRLDHVGYHWMVAGENLGEGQKTFDEVLEDWLHSYSHCTMLMNPKVNEMAVAKVGKYWVQHFGKQMPQQNIVQPANK